MVHKFRNKVENFLFSEMPVDSMDYERKGGCFVTTSKGVILTILFVIFGFLLGLLVFYTTKHVYEISPPISIEEFIQKPYEYIGDSGKISVIPKHYRIILNPVFNSTENPFSFNGNVWITITPNDDNIKTIKLDIGNLFIHEDDVSVYRSRILSDLNFQESATGKRSAESIEDERPSGVGNMTGDESLTGNKSPTGDESISNENPVETQSERPSGSEGATVNENPIGDKSSNKNDTFETSINSTNLSIVAINEQPERQEVTSEAGDVYHSQATDGPSSVTENSQLNVPKTWNGLQKNDTNLLEFNPDDQTELEVNGIQIDVERGQLIINVDLALRKGHYYIVKVFFIGKMSTNYGLVYESYNSTDANDEFIAATITEPNHIPDIFPCFNNFLDDVTFELNLIHRTGYQSISVSKLTRTEKITNDWILDLYERTAPMRLNNFGFVITSIKPVIVTASPNLLLNSHLRSNILPNITFIDSDIPKIIKDFEAYTNATYPMNSISFVGVPNLNSDVVEIKHGLVIASENMFVSHDESDKSNRAAVIAHKMGQLWCQPWNIKLKDQAWVNKALPLQLKLIGIINALPKSNSTWENIAEKRLESMRKEESLVGFSLVEFGNHDTDVNWNDIAESKGLFVLDAIKQFLTPPTYQAGAQKFFKSKSNESMDLLRSFINLKRAADSPPLISLEQIIRDWSTLIGIPLIHIQRNSNNIEIQQTEFGKSRSTQFWTIPIKIKEQIVWLERNSKFVDVEDNNWLTLQTNGYYRVNYDENHWKTILEALQLDHTVLSTVDRAILMDDAFNLAKNNYLNYTVVAGLLHIWNERETEFLPWKTAFNNLEFVYRNSIEFEPASGFNSLLKNLTQRAYQNIVRSPLGGFSYKLKVLIKKWSCQTFSLPDCVADSVKDFQNLINNDSLKKSQKSNIDIEQLYCTAIRFGDRDRWDVVRNNFNQSNNKNYNNALVYSLGCSLDHRTLNEYFQFLLNTLYNEYAEAILTSMSENALGHKLALGFLFTHFQQLHKVHGLRPLKILLNSIATEYDYAMFQLYFSKNASLFSPKDNQILIEIVHTIKRTLNSKHRFAELSNT